MLAVGIMSPSGDDPAPDPRSTARGGHSYRRGAGKSSTWPPRNRVPRRLTLSATMVALMLLNIALTAAVLWLTATGR
jgi:hypothetical protein